MRRQISYPAFITLALVLAGCDDPALPGQPYRGAPATSAETIETARVRAWPPAQRAAYMQARLIAARILAETAGDRAAATALIEAAATVYEAAPSDMLAAGLAPDWLGAVRAALEAGDGDASLPEALAGAEASLAAIGAGEGSGAPEEVIAVLIRLCAEAYESGVSRGEIRRAVDYQTAFGLAVLARDIAAGLDPEAFGTLQLELRMLVLMWPSGGPVASAVPPPEFQMAEQFIRIRSALAAAP